MRNSRGLVVRALGWLALAACTAAGQQIAPHIGYVYPAGGQRGATSTVTVGGQFLGQPREVLISGAGIQARVVGVNRPMPFREFRELREEAGKLNQKRKGGPAGADGAAQPADAAGGWTPAERARLAELRRKLATAVVRPVTPAIAEQVTVEVTIAPDAEPGDREIRLVTPNGLTNPLLFAVGQWPEHSEPPAKARDARAEAAKVQFGVPAQPKRAAEPVAVTLPVTINGQIEPGSVDRYKFRAEAGQKIVIAARARELIPYISDAVPGWFEAAIALYDAAGKEVDYADHFQFKPDPVLCHEVREAGEFVFEVRDSIYRGREDFVYRITVGEVPYLTNIFPLGGKEGAPLRVEMNGWNLASPEIAQYPPAPGMRWRQVAARQGDLISNRVPFAADTLPEILEHEPNNDPRGAMRVTLPLIVNGRISQPGDTDVFSFEGTAGAEIVAEVLARRLDSPLDSRLTLTDATGKLIAANDDYLDKGAGLVTHHADSLLTATLPADGTYYLHLSDAQSHGSSAHGYRLRVSPPRPDFELRVTPASLNLRGGMTMPVTVYALRRDGFSGDIAVRLKDAPPGFRLSGGVIPGGQDHVRMTLTAPVAPGGPVVPLRLEGSALINGVEVTRTGTPAEDLMQAFAYRHLVPSETWLARLLPGGRRQPNWQVASLGPVRLPAGGTAPVRVRMPLGKMADQFRLELNDPPEGLSLKDVSASQLGVTLLIEADSKTTPAGLRGNLIVDVFLRRPPSADKKNTPKDIPLGTLPAIPFEIAGNAVATK